MSEKEIVEYFLNCFKRQDVSGMCSVYTSDIVYFDPLADLLKEKEEVKWRWKLFFEDASNCNISTENIVDEGEGYYTCKWTASFNHSETGRAVTLKSKSNFKLEHNLITEHSEAFSLHQYCKQVYGAVAYVIGWNSMYQKARKNEFRRRLLHYLNP
jgi:ketosteroid isomerase-like protein